MDPNLPSTILSLTEGEKKMQNLMATVDRFRLCDLPDEIFIDILGRLDSLSRVRFSAVCRTWHCHLRRLLTYVADAQDLPWFLTIDFHSYCRPLMLQKPSFLILYDQKPCTTIKCELEDPINEISPRSINHYRVKGTQFGWIVFCLDHYVTEDELFLCDNNIFLYSPFTKKIFTLPPDPHISRVVVDLFTMSHPPTCSDCVFFVFSAYSYSFCHDDEDDEVEHDISPCIYTCCHGESKWKKHNIGVGRLWLQSVTFLAGTFYCKFHKGGLAAFNPADGSWQVLTNSEPPQEHGYSYSYCLTVSDGNVLLVRHVDCVVGQDYCCRIWNSCSIWKYQWAERGWGKMESLGGRALFLNNCGEVATVAALVEVEPFADRIYFPYPDPHYVPVLDRESHDDSIVVVGHPKGAFWIMPPPFDA